MSRLASARTKINNKVFEKMGTDGTIETVASSTTDKWGDTTYVYNTAVTTKVVPYNLFDNRNNFRPFGDLGERESDAVIPYDDTFNRYSKISFDGDTYYIRDIEKFLFIGGNLAFAVRLVKEH